MVGRCVIGAGEWLPRRADVDEWRAVLTEGGVPVADVRLPDPGATDDAFRRAALDGHADGHRSYWELLERIERRLGVPERRPAALTCSVVVCTHRRPEMLAGFLNAAGKLDPRPHQLVVVDNDPGPEDVRALAGAAGAVYVREDRRGLDNARAAGLAAATGDLVAFTDDDCLPSQRWLRNLPELFDDPRVAAVTGPAFAHELDTDAELAFEESGGFGRGLHRRVHEWMSLSPTAAGRAGAGANMIFRRAVAEQLGELFPPELDAGTATESGGDFYALYRLLAAGYRVVYDPGTWVFHRHRQELEAMHRAFRGYGVGLSAALTKLLVEERELTAPAAWMWLVRQWLESLQTPRDHIRRQIARDYLAGGLRGPLAWTTARRHATTQRRRTPTAIDSCRQTTLRHHRATEPEVSVIVTTHSRPHALKRCADALAQQTDRTPPFELIVVNDGHAPVTRPPGARVIDTGGAGTAGARNAGAAAARGRLLIFLDDDLVPDPELVARHAEAHTDGSERVVIGYCEPRPRERNLASLGAASWWDDHYRALREAASFTFMDMLSGNMSVPRTAFERIGGFDPGFGRREDWEWGIRVLEAGVEVLYEARARAVHEFLFSARKGLAAARNHGRCDAALIARHPATAASLPARCDYRGMLRRPLRAMLFLAAQRPTGEALGAIVLGALELAKARPAYSRLFTLMLGAAYERGRREGGDPRKPPAALPVVDIELDSDDPIRAPAVVAPRVRLLAGGALLAEFRSYGGHWGRGLAQQIALAGHRDWWRLIQAGRGESAAKSVELIAQRSWAERDRAIRASRADAVVIALDGCPPHGRWVAQAAEALGAERVALALGAWLERSEPPHPVTLHSRRTDLDPFPAIGRPPRYIALRRDAYRLLGGFDTALADLGAEAVVLELVERALEAGWLVARRDVAAAEPAGERAASLRRTRARAALLAQRAQARGKRPPFGPALGRIAAGLIPGGKSLSGGIAHAAAWTAGVVTGSRYRRTASPLPPVPVAAEPSAVPASQRWSERSRPLPVERPVTRSG